jgi:hypothetical protein
VETGSVLLALPTAGTDGTPARLPLAPSGRQIDLALSYGVDLARPGGTGDRHRPRAELGAALSLDHGHRDGARAAAAFAAVALPF